MTIDLKQHTAKASIVGQRWQFSRSGRWRRGASGGVYGADHHGAQTERLRPARLRGAAGNLHHHHTRNRAAGIAYHHHRHL